MKSTMKLLVLALVFTIFSNSATADELVGSILDANVNSDYEDYNSFIIFGEKVDTLFFTSSRPVPNRRPIALAAEMFYSTRPAEYRLQKKPINEGWSKAKQIEINSSRIAQFTRGTQTIASDRIIFAAERDLSTTDATGTSYLLDLWEMTKSKEGFTLPTPITKVNDPDAWDSQPALSPDGKILIFTSNRPGGMGGLDLWYSIRDIQGNWVYPKLVPNINTPGNETSPHFGADGKFYFSSDWNYKTNNKNENRKDIYRADYADYGGVALPINPVNLDEAIRQDAEKFNIEVPEGMKFNSEADDEFPFITPDRAAIFITSNRKADFDKRNLFAFSMPKSKIRLLVNVTETILDSQGNLLIPATKKTGLELNLTEQNSGKTTIIKSGIPHEVEAEKTYIVSINKFVQEECYQNKIEGGNSFTVTIPKPFGLDTLIIREMHITRQKVQIPPIIFHASDTLPYFITGYWYPNTSENLREFRKREATGFFNSTGFVDSTGYDYDKTSKIIDRNFYERLYKPLLEKLPAFQDFCRDTLYLKITIHGYTDPRGLSAGEDHPYREASRYKRNYPDKTITVGVDSRGTPVTIHSGLDMWKYNWPIDPNNKKGKWIKLKDEGQNGNILLSKLRAYFTFVTFDRQMQKLSPIYKQMRQEGRIILDAEGFGIDKEGFKKRGLRDDPQSRRIEIYIDILRSEELQYHKRLPGGKVKSIYTEQKTATEKSAKEKKYKAPQIDTEIKPETKPEIESVDKGVEKTSGLNNLPDNDKILAPLEPDPSEVEQEPVRLTQQVCYTIQFSTYKNQEDATKALNVLQEAGLSSAKLHTYIDPFGNALYRLRYGCFNTAEEAVNEINNLRWIAEKLNLKKKPAIIKEKR